MPSLTDQLKCFTSILFLTLCLSASSCYAQHNHSDEEGKQDDEGGNGRYLIKNVEPKHGGELVTAGKYKLEVVCNILQNKEKISVYVIKGKKEMSIENASGEAKLRYRNGRTDRVKLILRGNKMILDSIQVSESVNIEFKIMLADKNISGIYYYPGLKEGH